MLDYLSTGGIVGIIVAVLALGVIWGLAYIWVQRRKRRVDEERAATEGK